MYGRNCGSPLTCLSKSESRRKWEARLRQGRQGVGRAAGVEALPSALGPRVLPFLAECPDWGDGGVRRRVEGEEMPADAPAPDTGHCGRQTNGPQRCPHAKTLTWQMGLHRCD